MTRPLLLPLLGALLFSGAALAITPPSTPAAVPAAAAPAAAPAAAQNGAPSPAGAKPETASGQPAAVTAEEPATRLRLAAPLSGAYTGAYIDFGDNEDRVTLERIEDFATLVGKHQALVAFGCQWGSGHFPTEQVHLVHNAGAVPLILWYPWRNPDDKVNPKYDIERILAGDWDAYLDNWAHEAAAIRQPVLVSWAVEMNGSWYAWSGLKHGAGKVVPGSNPPRYQGPEVYKRAYRYVVDRVRKAGARNVSWVFHTNSTTIPDEPWNRPVNYYPGSDYVDWLAMSAYGAQFPGSDWYTAKQVLVDHYKETADVDPSKPVLYGEWGVADLPRQGDKAQFLREAFPLMEGLPRLKGAIFWHERWQNSDLTYSNLRVNSSLESLQAYRDGVAGPFWLPEPQYAKERSAAVPAGETVGRALPAAARPGRH